ncbi:ABC transporter permease subunit [Alteromonas sp. CYL-A6]|uniref:ABC transporter permease subunit n=1 Tax=Alteromonas nitratireducens TaxID=3390813 RepID=UPI0034AC1AD4
MRHRTRRDNAVRYVVTTFGALVLLTLVILISHLLMQALPLALRPALTSPQSLVFSDGPGGAHLLTLADVEEGQPLVVRQTPCALTLMQKKAGALDTVHDYKRPCGHALSAISDQGRNYLVDISTNGLVRIDAVRDLTLTSTSPVTTRSYETTFGAAQGATGSLSFSLPRDIWAARVSWSVSLSSQWAVVTVKTADTVLVRWVNRQDPTTISDQYFSPSTAVKPLPGVMQTVTYDQQQLAFHSLREGQVNVVSLPEPMTWWQSLEKDRSLFIADSSGLVTRWVLRAENGILTFAPTYHLSLGKNEQPRALRAHASVNALAMLTSAQRVLLINRVSGEQVTTLSLPEPHTDIAWFGNRLYAAGTETVTAWTVKYLSGITTWSSLFEPQEYEGYPTADMVWQTTNASDYLEAKYSLTPLLIGSLKASLLALLVAIPVAVSAAVYTAFFADNRLRQVLKPAIEMLEAIPSVLIGFIAAIWLSPVAEQFLFSFVFVIVLAPLVLLGVAALHHTLTPVVSAPVRHVMRITGSIALVLGLGYLSIQWSPWLTDVLFGAANVGALDNESASPVGKTTLVVAIALGVAISPSIYSLAEDAISGVPDSLKHASYALGATRLQTLRHVVMHVAMPGILAAIMLGFGRAFGETMIVLMVTGNTPIASWSLFDGLRAMTANLAIELPEADASGTHYHILFFTACILFAFTFVVNTLAEFLRRRLRRNARYG